MEIWRQISTNSHRHCYLSKIVYRLREVIDSNATYNPVLQWGLKELKSQECLRFLRVLILLKFHLVPMKNKSKSNLHPIRIGGSTLRDLNVKNIL